jgi:hypothetical protein
MEKLLTIDGKEVGFKATGATVRLYRQKFGKDLLLDMNQLNAEYQSEDLSRASLEVFENLAYIMAKQYDKDIPESPDDWLDEFNMFSIYEIFPELIGLWNASTVTQVKAKKK